MRIYYPKAQVRVSKQKNALPKKKGGSLTGSIVANAVKPIVSKARSIRPIRFTF